MYKLNSSLTKGNIGGYLLVLVLVLGASFFLVLSSFIGYIVTQSQVVNQRISIQQATDVAEAGLNYYKWYLAHYPNSVVNVADKEYLDPEGVPVGKYSLTVASSTYCGDVASIYVTSEGYAYSDPSIVKTLMARFAQPTVAEYAYIINSNVWAGADRVIVGPYHSNGGIRMDGTNNSVVTSGQTTWTCTSSFGCTPNGARNGVFTTTGNANTALFSFPSAPINFTGLTIDLSLMQDRAINAGGIYIPPSGTYGYEVVFNSNDTITVRRVTNTTQYWGYTTEDGWQQERHVISNTSGSGVGAGTYNINSDCPLIFVKDKVWLRGVVSQKVTLAAADVESAPISPQIILSGNVTYTSATTSGLLAIAEEDVLVGVNVTDDTVLNGIFVAQNGRFGRNHYCASCNESGNSRGLPNALDPYVFRDSLTVNGTIVSNGREGTQWTSGGVAISGFLSRFNSYDRNLVENPPPLVPETSDVLELSDWRDMY